MSDVTGQSQRHDEHSAGPSMYNGMSTTVPQNIVQPNLNSTHQPSARRRRRSRDCCCGVKICIVVLQLLLGCAITLLAFYGQTLVTSMRTRESPYWAGIPVSSAAVATSDVCLVSWRCHKICTVRISPGHTSARCAAARSGNI